MPKRRYLSSPPPPSRLVQVVTLLTCIWEVPRLNLSWDTNNPDCSFLLSPSAKSQYKTLNQATTASFLTLSNSSIYIIYNFKLSKNLIVKNIMFVHCNYTSIFRLLVMWWHTIRFSHFNLQKMILQYAWHLTLQLVRDNHLYIRIAKLKEGLSLRNKIGLNISTEKQTLTFKRRRMQ
jgi:hypothetical protein